MCNIPLCYGTNATNPSVCSGNGNCVSKDSCSCNSGWTGSLCNLPICFGVNSTSSTVCNSQGNCTLPDTCLCNSKYTGTECTEPICYGLGSKDVNVCSAHGVCFSPNNCSCVYGWSGSTCSSPLPAIASDDVFYIPRGFSGYFNVLENDTSPSKFDLIIDFIDTYSSSNVKLVNNGTSVFYQAIDSATNYIDTFTYSSKGVQGGDSSNIAKVTVYTTNIPPVAVEDSGTVLWNRKLSIDLLSNDYDLNPYDNSRLYINTIIQPKSGIVQIDSMRLKTSYTPNTNFVGVDTFSYSVIDPLGATHFTNVTINVINNAPVAYSHKFSVHWGVTQVLNVLSNAFDMDGDSISILNTTSLNVKVTAGSLVYTAPDTLGIETFTYTITDGNKFASANVTVNVTNVSPFSTNDDSMTFHWLLNDYVNIFVLNNDFDTDGDKLSIVNISRYDTKFGSFEIKDGSYIQFKSSKKYYGQTNFTYTITDGVDFSSAHVILNLLNLNAPIANPVTRVLHWRNFPARFDVLTTNRDLDADPIYLLSSDLNSNLIMQRDLNSQLDYFELSKFVSLSNYTWNFEVSDGSRSTSSICTANVYDNPPTGVSITISVTYFVAHNYGVFVYPLNYADDIDLQDQSNLNIPAFTQGQLGQVSKLQYDILKYMNTTANNQTDSFNYTLSDGLLTSNYSVTIDVGPLYPNGTETYFELYYEFHHTVVRDGVNIDPTINFGKDIWLTGVIIRNPGNGNVLINSPFTKNSQTHIYSFNYTVVGFLGYTSFILEYTDGVKIGNVHITILVKNNRPIAPMIKFTTHWAKTVEFDLLKNCFDYDNDTITLLELGTSSCASLSFNNITSKAILTPSKQIGPDCFITYKITDGNLNTKGIINVNITNIYPSSVDPKKSCHWSVHAKGFLDSNIVANDYDPNNDSIVLLSFYQPIPVLAGKATSYGVNGVNLTALIPSSFVNNTLTYVYLLSDTVHTSYGLYSLYIWNSLPTGVSDSYIFNGTVPQSTHTLYVLNNDYDIDQSQGYDYNLTISSVDYTGSGSVKIINSKYLNYTPPSKFVGTEVFYYTITDGMSISLPIAVSCRILNTPPIGVDDIIFAFWNSTTSILPLTNDYDINSPPNLPLSLSYISKTPIYGASSISGNNILFTPEKSLTYSIDNGQNATLNDQITFRLSNSYGRQSTSNVHITIYDTRPIANPDNYTLYVTPKPFVANLDILSNDYDQDGDSLLIFGIESSSGATIISNKKIITYTPKSYIGTETFKYTVTDNQLISKQTTVTVNLYPDCYGKHSDSPLACSGHGNCTAPNKCTCSSTWGDLECQSPICYGIVSTNSLTCSGQGSCGSPNNCTCSSSYFTGENCQYSWYVWKGVSGSWDTPSNWWVISDLGWKTATRYPVLNDVVYINVTGQYTITANNLNIQLKNMTFGGSSVSCTLNITSSTFRVNETFYGYSGSIIRNINSTFYFNYSEISSNFSSEQSGKMTFSNNLLMNGSWTYYSAVSYFQFQSSCQINGNSIIDTTNFYFSSSLIIGGSSTLRVSNSLIPTSTQMIDNSILSVATSFNLINQISTSSRTSLVVESTGNFTITNINFKSSISCYGSLYMYGSYYSTDNLLLNNCQLYLPTILDSVNTSLSAKSITGGGYLNIYGSLTLGGSQVISVNLNNSYSKSMFDVSCNVVFTLPVIMANGMDLKVSSSVTFTNTITLQSNITGLGTINILNGTLVFGNVLGITCTSITLGKMIYPLNSNLDINGIASFSYCSIILNRGYWNLRQTSFNRCNHSLTASTLIILGTSTFTYSNTILQNSTLRLAASTFSNYLFNVTSSYIQQSSTMNFNTGSYNVISSSCLYQNTLTFSASSVDIRSSTYTISQAFSLTNSPIYTLLDTFNLRSLSLSTSSLTSQFTTFSISTTTSCNTSPLYLTSVIMTVASTSTFTASNINAYENVTIKSTGAVSLTRSTLNCQNNSTLTSLSTTLFNQSPVYLGTSSSLLSTGSSTFTSSTFNISGGSAVFNSFCSFSSSPIKFDQYSSCIIKSYSTFSSSSVYLGSYTFMNISSYANFSYSPLIMNENVNIRIYGNTIFSQSQVITQTNSTILSSGLGLFTGSPLVLNFGNSSYIKFKQGNCTTGLNICSCESGYTGETCQLNICYGKNSSDSSVCSSQGSCTSPDTCSCRTGWSGMSCEFPSCSSINSTATQVCSYHGKCISLDSCLCDSGWTGQTCSLPICYGINSTSSQVCSAHGTCVGVDNCTCLSGWTGQTCSVPMCFGINSTSTQVCSAHGTCISKDSCSCSSGWTGQTCSLPICFGINSTSTSVCSSKGTCMDKDTCSCSSGWTGQTCSIPMCYGINSTSSQVCSAHGTCTNKDTCSCSSGWTGQTCSLPICFGINSTSTSVCSSKGTCISKDTCSCQTGWTGQTCSIPMCYGINSTSSQVCSAHGTCINKDTCSCTSGWTGQTCSLPICFGINSTSTSVCSSKGTCIDKDTCSCFSGWTGQTCSTPMCFGINSTSTSVCSAHGSCTSKDTCSCITGWSGPSCSTPLCFGNNATNSSVCSFNGVCKDKDVCQCNQGWTGPICSLPLCFGYNSTNPNVCSTNGQCVEKDVCQCNGDYFGQNCNCFSTYSGPGGEFEFVTSLEYPFILDSKQPFSVVQYPPGLVPTIYDISDPKTCNINEPCNQRFQIKLEIHEACSFTGNYLTSFKLACHPSITDPKNCPLDTNRDALIEISANSENFCAQAKVEIDLFGSLNSFSDDAFVNPKSVFLSDQRVYFLAQVQSPKATITSSSIIRVQWTQNDISQVLYDRNITGNGKNQGFSLGPTTSNTCSFSFIPSAQYINMAVDSNINLNISATVQVTYQDVDGLSTTKFFEKSWIFNQLDTKETLGNSQTDKYINKIQLSKKSNAQSYRLSLFIIIISLIFEFLNY